MKNFEYFFLFMWFSAPVCAQIAKPHVSIVSPAAAAIALNNEVPVSHYNGTVAIQVPLFKVAGKEIEVPISLSYNTSGVRPDQHPGPVGMNWSMMAGGSVSRIVRGLPDETFIGPGTKINGNPAIRYWPDIGGKNWNGQPYPMGYLNHTSVLNTLSWNSTSYIKSLAASWIIDATTFSRYSYDVEPDEYSFNIAGSSGKFFIGPDGNVRIEANPNMRINVYIGQIDNPTILTYYPLYNSRDYQFAVHNIITGIELVTDNGTRYIFGYIQGLSQSRDWAAVEPSIDFFQQFYSGWSVNTWNVSQIISAAEDTIQFSYIQNPYPIAHFSSVTSYQYSQTYNKSSGFLGWIFGTSGDTYRNFSSNQCRGNLILPSYLAEISTRDVSLSFHYSESIELPYNYNLIASWLAYQAAQTFDGYLARNLITGASANPFNIPPYTFSDGGDLINLGARYWIYDNLPSSQWTYYTSPNNPYVSVFQEPLNWNLLKWFKLDRVELRDKNVVLKKVHLAFSERTTQRLHLLSITEEGSDGSRLPAHQFGYDNYLISTVELPPYLSTKLDHWGFYNNRNSIISDFSNATLTNYYSLRQTDPDYLYRGRLTYIRYPTGGESWYTFEPNYYEKVRYRDENTGSFYIQNESGYAGGLRIKQIRFDALDGSPEVITNFNYEGGILNGKPRYYWPVYNGKTNADRSYSMATFLSESLLPGTTNSAGNHIDYSKVTESISGRGKTVFYFSDLSSNPDANYENTANPQRSIYLPFSERYYERGLLLKRERYANDNTIRTLDEFSYQTSNTARANEFIPGIGTKQIVMPGLYPGTEFGIEATAYKRFIYPYDQVIHKTTSYPTDASAGSMTITKTRVFGGLWENLLRSEEIVNSRGQVSKRNLKYPSDYSTEPVFQEMRSRNMVASVVEETEFINNSQVKLQRTDYFRPFPTRSLFLPKRVRTQIRTTDPLVTTLTLDKYDQYGNLVQATDMDGTTTSFLWGYKGMYPVLKAINGGYSSIESLVDQTIINSPSDDNALQFELNKVRSAIPSAFVTSYTYRPLVGMSSQIDPNNKALLYGYDKFGRINKITDANLGFRTTYCYNYAGQTVPCLPLVLTGSSTPSTLALLSDGSPSARVSSNWFTAEKVEKSGYLSWTATDFKVLNYEIQKSSGNNIWKSIGSFDLAIDSVAILETYLFTDHFPYTGLNVYRLKIHTSKTEFTLSEPRNLYFEKEGETRIFPNPVTVGREINVQIDDISLIKQIEVFDQTGTLRLSVSASRSIDIGGLAAGVYVLRVVYSDGTRSTHRIVKQ